MYNGCGATKNCFGTPAGCIETKNCIAMVTVLVRGERYLFELQARDSKYVAVGLSDDSKMVTLSVLKQTRFINSMINITGSGYRSLPEQSRNANHNECVITIALIKFARLGRSACESAGEQHQPPISVAPPSSTIV